MPSFDIDINFRINTGELESAQKTLQEVVDTDNPDIDIHANDSEIKTAKKELDDMQGEKVDTEVEVNTSSIKTAKKELEDLQSQLSNNMSSTGNAINGVIGSLAGKSIWDTIYGTSAKAETNKVLIKNMGDTTEAYDKLYDKIDTTTDKSLISMQQLIPAMNGIKSATGASAKEMDAITPKVANFGQYVFAMTGSSARAEQAMFDLSKGIKGAYASLDQYGITEDALMRTGLWSGKEEDVEGYMAAVNEVTGGTEELMGTATGMEALMGKSFSRAGKKIGETVLPAVKSLLGGFNALDAATDGWLSTVMLIGGGIGSSVVTGLSAFEQAKTGYDALKGSLKTIQDAMKIAPITTFYGALAGGEGIIAAVTAGYDKMAISEYIALGPLLAIIGAIIILGVAIYEVGKYFGWWSDVGTMLESIQAGLQRLWAAFINNPDVQAFIQGIKNAWIQVSNALKPVVDWVMNFLGIHTGGQFDIVRALINGVASAWRKIKPIIMVVIKAISTFVSRVASGIARAKQTIETLQHKWNTLKNAIRGAATGIKSAITAPFQQAWGIVKPIYDKFKTAVNWGKKLIGWSGAEFEGFNTGSVGYEGFNGTLNDSYFSNSNTSNNSVVNNFNINGIIEEEASQYIVNSVNDHIKKQNLIRGV